MIPSFKDQLITDMQIFMNTEEFAEMHMVDGVEMKLVIDDDELQQRKSSASSPTEGVYSADLLFYVQKTEFNKKPVIGKPMRIDDRRYLVLNVQEDDAMYTVTLERNGS